MALDRFRNSSNIDRVLFRQLQFIQQPYHKVNIIVKVLRCRSLSIPGHIYRHILHLRPSELIRAVHSNKGKLVCRLQQNRESNVPQGQQHLFDTKTQQSIPKKITSILIELLLGTNVTMKEHTPTRICELCQYFAASSQKEQKKNSRESCIQIHKNMLIWLSGSIYSLLHLQQGNAYGNLQIVA